MVRSVSRACISSPCCNYSIPASRLAVPLSRCYPKKGIVISPPVAGSFVMRFDRTVPEVLHNLVLDEALATVDCSEAERVQFRCRLYQEKPYQAWLTQQGVTPEQFEIWLDRELRIRKFQRQRWSRTITSYFLQRKSQLDQVICSLIYLQELGIAQELYFRIVEGEQSFAEIANLYSEATETRLNGVVGPIELGQLPERLARMFYGGRPGQLWPPTKMGEWIIIAQLNEILPVQLNETMRQTLFNELLEGWIAAQIKQRFP